MKKLLTTLALSASLAFSATTIVTVNDHKITDTIAPQYAKADKAGKAKLKQQLIEEELILSYALKSKASKDESFKKLYDAEKAKISKAYKAKFNKSLDKEQLRNLKGAIALRILLAKEAKNTKVSDKEAKEFFTQNKKKFDFPDSIELAIIDSKTKKDADKILKQLSKAKDIPVELMKIAKSKKQRGYLGWIPKNGMKKEVFAKIYKNKKATLLKKPILENKVYSVVYLVNKRKAGSAKFEEVKANLKAMLLQQKTAEWAKKKVAELKKTAKIK